MNLDKLSKNHESWIDNRSEREIHDDHMYEEYLIEKKRWGEAEILSREEYIKQNKLFLSENFLEWQKGNL